MCKGGELDLSFESLTSHMAHQVLRELPTTNPEFFAEISQSHSHVNVTPTLTPEQEALESLSDPAQVYVPNDTGGLTTMAAAEDALVELVNDVVVDVTPQDDPRPTRRNRRRNVLYNKDWWADSRNSDDEEVLDDKDSEHREKHSRKPARKA